MTRVEIFKKWINKELTDEEAIRETRKAKKPIIHNDKYTDVWYEGEVENALISIRLLEDDGYAENDITCFIRTIIREADKDQKKEKPNWKHAKEIGMDTKKYKKMIK